MTYNNENAMMETKKDFILPAMVEDDCISVDVSEDYEGLRLSFPRVKIPGGGSLQFEIPSDDPENPDYTKYIEGVILYNHDTCAYWPEGSEYDDNVTPLCSSVDGKTGYGAPGGVCATCALNQYGSVEKGKGKACKNMRNLYILRSGEHMPMACKNDFERYLECKGDEIDNAAYALAVALLRTHPDQTDEEVLPWDMAIIAPIIESAQEELERSGKQTCWPYLL